ncbi:unnamed protein product [Ceutorhynchus assimilis]|uniref:Calmodulin-lysine N-methyltransferase n=1 Tax=Ceutorhynchus assimilis TaxID=467358 RepID=A0A9P0GN12_9CUCU|nr:unnamed protein product [Ceutorhynchus assimilis]
MDQSKDLNQNFKINVDQKVARRRWGILAKALKGPLGSQPSSPTDEISIRRISSFMLLETRELPSPPSQVLNDQILKRTWFEYSFNIDQKSFKLNIGHRNRTYSAEDLMGFNNTGNICIWPSEETLSYYVCLNLNMFEGKSVMEIGGGMSCLAGLFIAKYSSAKNVLVTDGNKTSIDNVQAILQCNSFACDTQCAILRWNEQKESKQFDVIISADCLFFDDYRIDFINCLRNHLASKGVALIMAPIRGTTLDSFILQARIRGLVCKKIVNYSDLVWVKRLELMDSSCDYDDNIHYPILLKVTKE